jgi:predicted nucleic acid-binding Zn ribbon protein
MPKARRSSIKPLASAIQELIGEIGIKKKIDEYQAVVKWAETVGDHIAKVSQATRIRQGVLFVSVRVSTWRNELQLRKAEIIKKLNKSIGEDLVKDIKFQ